MERRAWVDDANAAMLTDLYELTMLQAYFEAGMRQTAVFDLFVRKLPEHRNFLLAAGLEDALAYLERLRFTHVAIDHLATLGLFTDGFLDALAALRFTGEVRAVAEGTPVFANEPLLEVVAPLPEAQLAESFLLNAVGFQTTVASKATRIVAAAAGRTVVDFGLRRAHGADAAMRAARASYLAGAASTSNVLAGQVYGIPVAGTMAHSFVSAHDDEVAAFRHFNRLYPGTTLLVDTYDTLAAVRKIVALARELGPDFKVRAIRLDSGDLGDLAKRSREILDKGGLADVTLFASGNLDEYAIADLVARGAPISGFGVGSHLVVAPDAPLLDSAYKLVAYAGRGRMKLSTGKVTYPGAKQVWRVTTGGIAEHDVLGLAEDDVEGAPLLAMVMHDGKRTTEGHVALAAAREHARVALAALPARVRALAPAAPPYEVRVTRALDDATRELEARLRHTKA